MTAWDPALETGIAEIDEQHRRLFATAGRVVEAVQRGRAAAEIADALRFLIQYVREHFTAEEAMMRAHGYPQADAHAALHERIRRRLDELVAAYELHGGTEAMVGDVDAMMRGWLSLHIGEKDRALAEYLRGRGVAA